MAKKKTSARKTKKAGKKRQAKTTASRTKAVAAKEKKPKAAKRKRAAKKKGTSTKKPAAERKTKPKAKKAGAKKTSTTRKPAAKKKATTRPKLAAAKKKPSTKKKRSAKAKDKPAAKKKPSASAAPKGREAAARRSPKPEAPHRDRHLPWGYGLDRIRALPVDPGRLFVYWEVTDPAIETAREQLGAEPSGASIALRLYDTTGRLFDGTNAHDHRDLTVDRSAREWFFEVGRPGSEFFVEVGVKTNDGRFQKIARSRRVAFPRLESEKPSEPQGTEWMTVVEGAHRARREEEAPFQGPSLPEAGVPVRGSGAPGPGTPSREESVPESSEHATYGPWTIERYGADGELIEVYVASGEQVDLGPQSLRETFGGWAVYRSWSLGGGRFVQRAPRLVPGSSERLGASEWRYLGASELRLGGASERLRRGASERRWRGASELRLGGASERRLGGASERLWARSAYPPIDDGSDRGWP